MAKILVISFSELARDPRVTRQVRELSKNHQVTIAGFGLVNAPSFRNIDLKPTIRTPA
jgi:hypothetical protein